MAKRTAERESSPTDAPEKNDPAAPSETQPVGMGMPAKVLLVAALVLGIGYLGYSMQNYSLSRAEEMLNKKELNQALALILDYRDRYPDSETALALHARILEQLDRNAEAVRLFEKASPAQNEEMLAMANAYMKLERWSRAVVLLKKLVERLPTNYDIRYQFTACLVKMQLYKDAIESAQKQTQYVGKEPNAYVVLATLYSEIGEHQSAADAYGKVLTYKDNEEASGLQIPPEEFFLQYGQELLSAGNGELAEPQFRKALAKYKEHEEKGLMSGDLDERYSQLHYLIGNAIELQGTGIEETNSENTASAENEWRIAVKEQPENFAARQKLAQLYIDRGNFARALEYLSPVLKYEGVSADVAFKAAKIFAGLKNPDEEKLWLERHTQAKKREEYLARVRSVTVESPNSFWAIMVRAWGFASAGNWNEAAIHVEGMSQEYMQIPFVAKLTSAIRTQDPSMLPTFEEIPFTPTESDSTVEKASP